MQSAEASGKTVEDALSRALEQLGANRDEVEFVVIDEGRRGGLFGRGARDATVRVDRLTESSEGGSPASGADLPETRVPQAESSSPRSGGQRGDRAPRGQRPPPRQENRRPRGLDEPVPKLTMDDFLKPGGGGGGGPAPAPARSDRAPRPERPRSGPPRDTAPRERSGPPPERRRREDQTEVAPDIDAEEVEFAAHVIDDLLRIMEINSDLTIREPLTPGDGLGVVKAVVDISGDGLGLLIGRRGDTLTAFQYLVNLIVGRRFAGSSGVTIDVEHYRHRREEQIVSLATRMADRVRQTGSPITLEPMTASERRLVHLTFAEDPELETNSIGEGENRKVVISTRE